MPGPQLLLFDLDATLIRTGGAGLRAMNRAFLEVMDWPDALGRISPAGRTDPSIAREISRKIRGRDMTPAELDRFFSCYLELLPAELAQADDYQVLPGIEEFLEQAAGKPELILGLGTGNLEAGARIKLEPAKLNRYFAFGGFGSDTEDRPTLLRIAVERAQARRGQTLSPWQVVVIGDTPHDIHAGRAIQARTLAVATGPFSTEQLAAHQPDLAVADFTETGKVRAFLGFSKTE